MSQGITASGKVAFVSGANRGIGKAIVEELLAKGAAKVYAGARDTASLAEMVAQHGDKIVPVTLELLADDTIAAAAEMASDVDILVNNAGVLAMGNFGSGNIQEALKKNLDVNLWGVVKLTEAFLPAIKAKDSAAIVTVASVVGLGNMPSGLTYSASKAAVHSVIQGLRAELAATNILVAGVYPGPIDTDMAKDFPMDKETPENVAKDVVAGIEAGTEYIFPDPMAKQVGEAYMSSPLAVEQQFAGF